MADDTIISSGLTEEKCKEIEEKIRAEIPKLARAVQDVDQRIYSLLSKERSKEEMVELKVAIELYNRHQDVVKKKLKEYQLEYGQSSNDRNDSVLEVPTNVEELEQNMYGLTDESESTEDLMNVSGQSSNDRNDSVLEGPTNVEELEQKMYGLTGESESTEELMNVEFLSDVGTLDEFEALIGIKGSLNIESEIYANIQGSEISTNIEGLKEEMLRLIKGNGESKKEFEDPRTGIEGCKNEEQNDAKKKLIAKLIESDQSEDSIDDDDEQEDAVKKKTRSDEELNKALKLISTRIVKLETEVSSLKADHASLMLQKKEVVALFGQLRSALEELKHYNSEKELQIIDMVKSSMIALLQPSDPELKQTLEMLLNSQMNKIKAKMVEESEEGESTMKKMQNISEVSKKVTEELTMVSGVASREAEEGRRGFTLIWSAIAMATGALAALGVLFCIAISKDTEK